MSLAPLLLVGLLAAPLRAAQSPDVPANDGWVTDLADLLTPAQEAALEEQMESYKRGSGQDVALLTVPELKGTTIERLALEVGRTWKLGQVGEDVSALLVVSREEREVRIEVGRGGEGSLTDAISGRIVRDVIVPAFKRGDYDGGLRAGVEAIHAALGGNYAPLERSPGAANGRASFVPVVLGVLFLLFILGSNHRGGRGGRGSALPWILLGNALGSSGRGGLGGGFGGGLGGGGGGFSGFGGGGGFSGGGATGRW